MNIKPVIFIGWGTKACDLISSIEDMPEIPLFRHGYGSNRYSAYTPKDVNFVENQEVETELRRFVFRSIESVEKNLISIAQGNKLVMPSFHVIVVCTLFEPLFEKNLVQLLETINSIGQQQEKYILDPFLIGMNAAPDFPISDKKISFNNINLIENIFNQTSGSKLFRSLILFNVPFERAASGLETDSQYAKLLELVMSRERIWNGFETVTSSFSFRKHDDRACLAGSMGIHSLGYLPKESAQMMALCMKEELLENDIMGSQDQLTDTLDSLPESFIIEDLFKTVVGLVKTGGAISDPNQQAIGDSYEEVMVVANKKLKALGEKLEKAFDKALEEHIPIALNEVSENFGNILLAIIRKIKSSNASLGYIFRLLAQQILSKYNIVLSFEALSERIAEINKKEQPVLSEKQELYIIQVLDNALSNNSFGGVTADIENFLKEIYRKLDDKKQDLKNLEKDLEKAIQGLNTFTLTFGVINKILKASKYKEDRQRLESVVHAIKEKLKDEQLIYDNLTLEKNFLSDQMINNIYLPFSISEFFYDKFISKLNVMENWLEDLFFQISQIPSLLESAQPYLPDYEEAVINKGNCRTWYADYRLQLESYRPLFFKYFKEKTDTHFDIAKLAFHQDKVFSDIVDLFCGDNMAFMEKLSLSDILLHNVDRLSGIVNALYERSAPFTARDKSYFICRDELYLSNYVLTSENTKDAVDSIFDSYDQVYYQGQRKDDDITIIRIECGYPVNYIANYIE